MDYTSNILPNVDEGAEKPGRQVADVWDLPTARIYVANLAAIDLSHQFSGSY